MRVYVVGPMTPYAATDWNFSNFHRVAEALREDGFDVMNPAEHFNGDTTREYREYMRVSIEDVLRADRLVALQGWETSPGSRLEVACAVALGIEVLNEFGAVLYTGNCGARCCLAGIVGGRR